MLSSLVGLPNPARVSLENVFSHIAFDFDIQTNYNQPSATSPLFFDNLHFEHFDKNVNHESRLNVNHESRLTCSKWRLSKKRGLVADG